MFVNSGKITTHNLHWLPVLVLSCACLAAGPATPPDSFSVRTWQIPDGSTNTIFGLAQSLDGFLWIGTTGGLSEFDGVSFQTHAPGAPFGLTDSRVRMLLASRSGGLWVAIDGAVVFLRKDQPAIVVKQNVPPLRVATMAEDNEGALWLGYRAGPICRVFNGIATSFDTANGFPHTGATMPSLAVDSNGRVWLARSAPWRDSGPALSRS